MKNWPVIDGLVFNVAVWVAIVYLVWLLAMRRGGVQKRRRPFFRP
jgi:hypothetical protein